MNNLLTGDVFLALTISEAELQVCLQEGDDGAGCVHPVYGQRARSWCKLLGMYTALNHAAKLPKKTDTADDPMVVFVDSSLVRRSNR